MDVGKHFAVWGLLETYEDIDVETSLTPEILQQEGVAPVMETFLGSSLKKLDVYNDLAARLTPFKNFLDERFAPKQHGDRSVWVAI